MYLLRPALFALSAETAHELSLKALSADRRGDWFRAGWSASKRLRQDIAGVTFDHPLGMAAGFDKDARCYPALMSMGFSSVEIGTVTGHAQAGNPKPRLFRLKQDRAILNRMGFNNRGAEDAAKRLQKTRHLSKSGVLGVNIGKSKVVANEEAEADYAYSARLLAPYADYLVLNVSSPNTPGLRALQAVDRLRSIINAVRSAAEPVRDTPVPLFVKIAPDLENADIDEIAKMAREENLAGLIATNTTIRREGLKTNADIVESLGNGGLSGPMLRERSLEILKRLRSQLRDSQHLISVGGLSSPADAFERILAGASLLQLYTAFVYEGPELIQRIVEGIDEALETSPYTTLKAAVGAKA